MKKKIISIVITSTLIISSLSSTIFAKSFSSKQGVELNHVWNVKFNKTLGSNQDFSKVSIKDSNGNVVPVSVTIGSDNESITVTPTSNYSSNTNYTLTVDGIKDSNGDNLSDNATMQFTTASDSTNPTQPTEDNAILPQAVTFNADGTVNPITTNDYVNIKAYPGKGYGNYNAILNPDYDKNYGMKHTDQLGDVTPCYIDSNNVLNFAYQVDEAAETFSEGFQYNKYMKDQLREMMKSFVGTTAYDSKSYIDMSEMKEENNNYDSVTVEYCGIQSDGYFGTDFTYLLPIKPLKSIQETPNGEVNYQYYYTYRNIKDNANIVLEIDDYSILNDSYKVNNLKQSLYAAFGRNYYDKIYDFIKKQYSKSVENAYSATHSWNGNDSLTIGNITIYSTYYGRYFSFFLK